MLLKTAGMATKYLLAAFGSLAFGCATDAHPDDPAYALDGTGKADSAWCHVNFDSVEGSNIRVDYQIQSTTVQANFIRTATPLWLNVQHASLTTATGVHVWSGDQQWDSAEGYAESAKYNELVSGGPDSNIDLYRSEDATRFTGQLTAGLPISNYTNGDDEAWMHAHQFAVVIDSEWQTDPISGSHNFVTPDLSAQDVTDYGVPDDAAGPTDDAALIASVIRFIRSVVCSGVSSLSQCARSLASTVSAKQRRISSVHRVSLQLSMPASRIAPSLSARSGIRARSSWAISSA